VYNTHADHIESTIGETAVTGPTVRIGGSKKMNLKDHPSIEQLRELIQQADDYAGHHILWVKKNGDVELTRIPVDKTPQWFQRKHPEMQMRYEVFDAGNEYVGPEAATDEEYLVKLFDSLLRNSATIRKGRREGPIEIDLETVFYPEGK
jgi:hypothetical protein